jgi:hypothetical protein
MEIICVVMGLILTWVGLFQGERRLAYALLLLMVTLLLASALRDDATHSLFEGARDTGPLRAKTQGNTAILPR